jgi:hypothetical protein
LALGVTGTLSQFVGTITNNNNSATTGGVNTFQFSEARVDTSTGAVDTPCAVSSAGSAVNCTTVNKYGENGLVSSPALGSNESNTTEVQLQNPASPPAGQTGALTLAVPACAQSPLPGAGPPAVGDLCGATPGLTVAVACSSPTGQTPFDFPAGTLDAFAAGSPYTIATLAPGVSVNCTFTITSPNLTAITDLQDITATQPLTWTFTQV